MKAKRSIKKTPAKHKTVDGIPITANSQIKHVFVLMMENRSFDHMLGFSGITGTDAATSANTGIEGISAGSPATPNATYVMGNDPGHEFGDVLEQLTEQTVYNGGAYPKITNGGFVQNYEHTGSTTPNDILKCYETAKQLPVLTALAKEFAVCDHWYSSLPGPTWPNRFFVHAASSGGLDHSPTTLETAKWSVLSGFVFPNGTIFDRLTKAGKQWRIYHGKKTPLEGSIPGVAALKGIHLKDTHAFENFDSDLNNGYPYDYTFIEPNYGNILNSTYSGGQSQHPMDDVRRGEALIKSTYESLRKSTLWLNSLLIITYDEHGGFYDHIAPPPAVPPGDTLPHSEYNETGFPFDLYGVRVPAMVISAYTAKNSISHLTYDHASIPATIEKIFGLQPMTKRDATANTVCGLAALPVYRDTPKTIPDPAPMNVVQDALQPAQLAPPTPGTAPVDGGNLPGFLFVVEKAQQEAHPVQDALRREVAKPKTRSEARDFIEANLPHLMNK